MGVLNRGLYGPFLAQLVVVRRGNLSCTYCNELDEESDPVPTEVLKAPIDKLLDFEGPRRLPLVQADPH